VQEVVLETKSMINGYVVGLVIEMAVLSVANSVVLLIMGVKYAVLLGVVAAVLNIIPYLGIYTSIALTILVTLANNTPVHALQAAISLFVIHVLDANILMPRVVGSRVKMNPFITILAVIIGEAIWGIPGMFLFIPLTGIMKLVCDRVDGLEAWGMVMGVEEPDKPLKKIILNSKPAKPDD
jgi:predicted PurR-regulated permease PerM